MSKMHDRIDEIREFSFHPEKLQADYERDGGFSYMGGCPMRGYLAVRICVALAERRMSAEPIRERIARCAAAEGITPDDFIARSYQEMSDLVAVGMQLGVKGHCERIEREVAEAADRLARAEVKKRERLEARKQKRIAAK